jgi:hypothetical protein
MHVTKERKKQAHVHWSDHRSHVPWTWLIHVGIAGNRSPLLQQSLSTESSITSASQKDKKSWEISCPSLRYISGPFEPRSVAARVGYLHWPRLSLPVVSLARRTTSHEELRHPLRSDLSALTKGTGARWGLKMQQRRKEREKQFVRLQAGCSCGF